MEGLPSKMLPSGPSGKVPGFSSSLPKNFSHMDPGEGSAFNYQQKQGDSEVRHKLIPGKTERTYSRFISCEDLESSRFISCEDLETSLLSHTEKEGTGAIRKIMSEIEDPLESFRKKHLQLLQHNLPNQFIQNKLNPILPLPPPGFGVPQRSGGPLYMVPHPQAVPLPIGPPGLISRPSQPQPWSPALQAARKKEEELLQKLRKLQNQPRQQSTNDVIQKLKELSMGVPKARGNNINLTHSLEQIEQEVLQRAKSSEIIQSQKKAKIKNQEKKKKNKASFYGEIDEGNRLVRTYEIVSKGSSATKSEEEAKSSEAEIQTAKPKVKKPKKKKEKKKVERCEDNPLFGAYEMLPEGYLDIKKKILENLENGLASPSCSRKPDIDGTEFMTKTKKKKKKKKDRTGKGGLESVPGKKRDENDVLIPGVFSESIMAEDGEIVNKESPEKKKTRKKKSKGSEHFEPYISSKEVERGLTEKKLIKAELRINMKNNQESFITDPDTDQDILILGLLDRNRALEGDIVIVEIKDEEHWLKQKNGTVMKTGKVVYVVERMHHGHTVGTLHFQKGVFMLVPRDPRFPLLKIPTTSIPQNVLGYFKENKKDPDTLFKGLLLSWNVPRYANGMIQEVVGKRGDIEVETAAIFAELGLNKDPIPPAYNRFLPPLPYTITEEEINSRLDLRSEVIFTIDPATARDLDDAVSIKKLSEGEYEVGVHISDVTHFLQEGTPLDIEVSERATTVYMVERAYHMLPIQLCGLCSLLPGEDKLAVSVIFKLNEEGCVLETKFSRSIINSCVQLSYDHAQAFLDGEENIELPTIYNDVSMSKIKEAILDLNKLAVCRRKRRFDTGALKIDQPKVCFDINSDCVPQSMYIYELKESNRLIEEFMLLANEAVARYIHSQFPEIALLRRHEPPKVEMIKKLANSLQKLGIFLDLSCAGSLHQTLTKYTECDIARTTVLNQMCAKPMNRAMYFCCSDDTHHYALNLEKYTHFTSPIRRYADIVVHRILTACLGYTELPPWTKEDVRKFASTSNTKKYAAKRAGEMSGNFFRIVYIKSVGEIVTDAVITWVNSRSIDTTIPSMALNIRVYIDVKDYEYNENDIGSSLIIKWPRAKCVQVLQVFCVVKVRLKYSEKHDNLEAKLLPPEPLIDLPLTPESLPDDSILTKLPLVEQQIPLVEPESPLVEPEGPLVERESSLVERESPLVEREIPLVEREIPLVEQESLLVEPESPLVEPEGPLVERESPLVEREIPLVEREIPLVEQESLLVEPESPLVKPESRLVEQESPLVEPVIPLVKPESECNENKIIVEEQIVELEKSLDPVLVPVEDIALP